MSNNAVKTINNKPLSLKARTLALVTAVVAAVALPQFFHALGAVSGLGTALGECFLPMHLPVILVGFIAGPAVGAVAGLLAPAISFALSGMPAAVVLPFMMAELCFYGLASGFLSKVKMPVIFKVLLVQVIGRLARLAAVFTAVTVFDNTGVTVSSVWNAVLTGLPGIILQLVLIPLLVFWWQNRRKND